MSDAIEIIRDGNLIAKIIPDEDAENPRKWDNLCTIYYTSDRYRLGDERVDLDEMYRIAKNPQNIYMPIQCYIHGGVTMRAAWNNTYPDAQWDSGCSGVAVISKEKLRQEFKVKRISKKLVERAYEIIQGEVEVFSQYLEGDVYGIVVEKIDEEEIDDNWDGYGVLHGRNLDVDGEHVDSCWGFFGLDYARERAQEMLQEAVSERGKHIEHRHYVSTDGAPYTVAEWVPDVPEGTESEGLGI